MIKLKMQPACIMPTNHLLSLRILQSLQFHAEFSKSFQESKKEESGVLLERIQNVIEGKIFIERKIVCTK